MLLQKITINGVEYPIQFGFGALFIFERNTGKSAIDVFMSFQDSAPSVAAITELLKAGLENGAQKLGKDFKMSSYDVSLLLDEKCEDGKGVIDKVMQIFADSMPEAESATGGNAAAASQK